MGTLTIYPGETQWLQVFTDGRIPCFSSPNQASFRMNAPFEVDLNPFFRTKLSMISVKGRGTSMPRSRFTEAHMIGALKQLEAGRKAEDVAREVGVSKHTIYAWNAKYGGMDVSEAQEAKQLRDENTKLKKLVVDLSLDKEMLKALIAKNGWSS